MDTWHFTEAWYYHIIYGKRFNVPKPWNLIVYFSFDLAEDHAPVTQLSGQWVWLNWIIFVIYVLKFLPVALCIWDIFYTYFIGCVEINERAEVLCTFIFEFDFRSGITMAIFWRWDFDFATCVKTDSALLWTPPLTALSNSLPAICLDRKNDTWNRAVWKGGLQSEECHILLPCTHYQILISSLSKL